MQHWYFWQGYSKLLLFRHAGQQPLVTRTDKFYKPLWVQMRNRKTAQSVVTMATQILLPMSNCDSGPLQRSDDCETCWVMYNFGQEGPIKVIRHLLRRQLLRWWYLGQQRLRLGVMIRFLVRGRVRIKIRFRVRVTFNVSIYHRSNCRRSKCTFPIKL